MAPLEFGALNFPAGHCSEKMAEAPGTPWAVPEVLTALSPNLTASNALGSSQVSAVKPLREAKHPEALKAEGVLKFH